jgi:hypothetical protein
MADNYSITSTEPAGERHAFGNPYAGYRASRAAFTGAKFGGLSSSGVNPHSISGGQTMGANPNPSRFGPKLSPVGEDIGGSSHILNAAARAKATPRSGAHFGSASEGVSPIVGGAHFDSQRGGQAARRSPKRKVVDLPSPPYGMTAEPIGQVDMGDPRHPLTGGLVRKALPAGDTIEPTAVFHPRGGGPIARPFRFNSAAGTLGDF